jgi:hypothetical protein
MHTLARTGRIDKLSGGLCKSEDFGSGKQRLARFMAAGLVALCKGKGKNAREKCGGPRAAAQCAAG